MIVWLTHSEALAVLRVRPAPLPYVLTWFPVPVAVTPDGPQWLVIPVGWN